MPTLHVSRSIKKLETVGNIFWSKRNKISFLFPLIIPQLPLVYLLSIRCYLIQWLSWDKENQPKSKEFSRDKDSCNRKIPEGNK